MYLTPQPRFRFYGTPKNYLAVAAAILTGQIGRESDDLDHAERRVCEWLGAQHALALPQARVGIYLALRCLIRPRQAVILSPYTFFEVVNMVVCAGGRPVFADIELDTCNIDARQVEHLIDNDTGAVIATHLHGLACDIKMISEVCRAKGVALIEDAAHCFGGRMNGRHVGTFGDVGIFSFSLKKNVNAFYGGMAITSNKDLRDRMAEKVTKFPTEYTGRLLRRAGKCLLGDIMTTPPLFQLFTFPLFRFDFLRNGGKVAKLLQKKSQPVLCREFPEHYKRRMTSLQARLVVRQIGDVEQHIKVRLDHARVYHRGLSGLPEVSLPPLREDGSHIYLAFPIRVSERQNLVRYMMEKGRDVEEHGFPNAADLPCFSDYARECPNSRTVAAHVVLLPTYPGYGKGEVDKNIATIHSYFRRVANSARSVAARSL
jgi:dTDP-4-amino-4,6-dideoxygalactose transaminase